MKGEERSILLIDDDREFSAAIEKMLQKHGWDVTLAKGRQEIFEALSQNCFTVIISELRVREFQGTELMRELSKRNLNTPVIFLTAYGEVESYLTLMNMGAFEYINKPIKGQEIVSLINKVVVVNSSSAA